MYFKTLRNLSFGRGCPLNERAERWSSRQIVEYSMVACGNTPGELNLRHEWTAKDRR